MYWNHIVKKIIFYKLQYVSIKWASDLQWRVLSAPSGTKIVVEKFRVGQRETMVGSESEQNRIYSLRGLGRPDPTN